jgi:cytochrome P450
VNSTPANSADACELARTFGYWSPTYAADPYALFRRLRRDGPVAHSDKLKGYYILSRYEHVSAALRDHGIFTSTVLTASAIPVEVRPPVPPLDRDPPTHAR